MSLSQEELNNNEPIKQANELNEVQPSEEPAASQTAPASDDAAAQAPASEPKPEAVEPEAKAEETPAETAETEAKTEEAPAETAETEAKAEEAPAETAETEAKAEEAPAETAEPEAKAEEAPAETVETEAKAEETPAETAETEAKAEEKPAETAETEAKAEEKPAEAAEPKAKTEETPSKEKTFNVPTTKKGVIDRLKEISHDNNPVEKDEIELLKKTYYKLRHEEVTAQHDAFIKDGGSEDDFRPSPDTDEESFKAEMSLVKEKRAKEHEMLEQKKQENLKRKLEIIEKVKEFSASPEEANKNYDAFKALQGEWKETNPVPAENSTELWKNYQYAVENFYDMLKLNNEFREYDFKKNLEAKTHLCEAAEKLVNEPDPVSAFHQLQKLHQEFREIGPVAKDLREKIWERFKAASTIVNKRHQEYFEQIKEREKENLTKKTALCEKVEGISLDNLKSFADWDKITQQIIAIQAEWKTIGFTPKSMNTKIFERFRKACDNFFTKKAEYFKELRTTLNANYAKKIELCEKAEALKDSTDWNSTAAKLRDLQKQWKAIGSVPRKHSEAIWKRFSSACDTFFNARNEATASQRESESENLEKKKNIIEQLKAITAEAKEAGAKKMQELTDEWQEVGHVPFKYKDKIYKAYREQVDRICSELNIRRSFRRMENFKSQAAAAISKGENAMMRERERLYRIYEAKRGEINTYENNLGFLNISSKNGGGLLDEVKNRIANLKTDLEGLRKSIEEIDAKLKGEDEESTDAKPEKAAEAPKAEAAPAKPADEAPATEAEAPKAEAAPSKPADEASAPEAEAPKADAAPAKPADETPAPEAEAPKADAEPAKPADEASTPEAETPKAEAEPAKPADETPAPEAEAPKADAEPAKPADETPAPEAEAPKADAEPQADGNEKAKE